MNTRLKYKVFNLFLILVLFIGWAFANASATLAGTTGSVSGMVVTSNGAPLGGAHVELRGITASYTTTTNKTGTFTFTGLAPGSYYIECTAKSYARVLSAPFTVVADQTLSLNIAMQAVNTSAVTTLGRVTIRGTAAVTAAAPVVRLSNESFVKSGSLNIASALDKLPGVTVDYGYSGEMPGSYQYLSIRGAGAYGNSYENVVLEDGEPIRSGGYGVDLSGITPALYSNTEVVKGVAGSSVHGADSVGGTLNLVTRDPTKTEGGQFLGSLGQFGTNDFNIVESNTINRLGYVIDWHARGVDGYNTARNLDFVPQSWFVTPPTAFDSTAVGILHPPSQLTTLHSFFGKLRYDLSPSTYLISTYQRTRDFIDYSGAEPIALALTVNGATHPTDPFGNQYVSGLAGFFNTDDKLKYAYELHTQLFGGDLTLKNYNHYVRNDEDGTNAPPDECCLFVASNDRLAGEIASYTKRFGAHVLTISGSGDADRYYSAYIYGGPFYGAYASLYNQHTNAPQMEHEYLLRDDYEPNGKLDLTLALYHSTIDVLSIHRTDPKLNIVLRPNSFESIHASAGTGFAAPPLSDRVGQTYLTYAYTVPGLCPATEPACAAYGPNPGLHEERAVGYDVGFQRAMGEQGQLAIDLYRTNLQGHIYLGYIPAPAGLTFQPGCYPSCAGLPVLYLYTSTNIVRAVYQGAETSARVGLGHNLTLDASYNIQAAFPQGESVPQELLLQYVVNNQQLIGIPIHKYLASLNYNNRATGTTAFFDWSFYDKNNTFGRPPFSIYGAGASIAVNHYDKLHVVWSNIFNGNFIFPPLSQYTYPLTFGALSYAGAAVNGYNYPGYSQSFPVLVNPSAPRRLTLTFEHSWGSLTSR